MPWGACSGLPGLLVADHSDAHYKWCCTVLGWPPAASALEPGRRPWVLLAAALGRASLGERSVRSMRGPPPLAPLGLVPSATAAETINEEQKRGNENPV